MNSRCRAGSFRVRTRAPRFDHVPTAREATLRVRLSLLILGLLGLRGLLLSVGTSHARYDGPVGGAVLAFALAAGLTATSTGGGELVLGRPRRQAAATIVDPATAARPSASPTSPRGPA